MQISVVGLGRLGAPLAAVFASKGFRVIGTDLNRGYVDAINNGHSAGRRASTAGADRREPCARSAPHSTRQVPSPRPM